MDTTEINVNKKSVKELLKTGSKDHTIGQKMKLQHYLMIYGRQH